MTNWIFGALLMASAAMAFEPQESSERVYIPDQNVVVRDKQILINLGDELVPIARLATDAHGIYVYREDLPVGFWACDNGHVNYPWNFVCSQCGLPR